MFCFCLTWITGAGCAEGYARDATEIQNIQIAEGDVCHGLPIPIYMVFPRLFTCPTLETTNFKVGESHVHIYCIYHIYLLKQSNDHFPSFYECKLTSFSTEFEVNVVIVFHDDHLITENFPLKLCRV